ncbi:transposase [Sesbania bispinosa]|nr:transposase [Sesbania bispinosa]
MKDLEENRWTAIGDIVIDESKKGFMQQKKSLEHKAQFRLNLLRKMSDWSDKKSKIETALRMRLAHQIVT